MSVGRRMDISLLPYCCDRGKGRLSLAPVRIHFGARHFGVFLGEATLAVAAVPGLTRDLDVKERFITSGSPFSRMQASAARQRDQAREHGKELRPATARGGRYAAVLFGYLWFQVSRRRNELKRRNASAWGRAEAGRAGRTSQTVLLGERPLHPQSRLLCRAHAPFPLNRKTF